MSHGYISEAVRARLREQARGRCGYCLSVQQYVLGPLEIDHLIPRARGGTETEENLWLACRMCNGFKGTQTHARDPLTGRRARLFNPRRQRWTRHFMWTLEGTRIIGKTACGTSNSSCVAAEPCDGGLGQTCMGGGWLASASRLAESSQI